MEDLLKVKIVDIDDIFQAHKSENKNSKSADKFVILKNADILILITGKINKFNYHAQLIEWYCNKNDLTCSWAHKPDFLEIFESDYSICGGGYIKFNPDKKKYEFYGFSTAYGRFDNKKLIYILEHSSIINSTRVLVSK